uniref:Uncharacterized protein n=1 Tax=Rhizophora mucronata TaxID=61149 RepID=A0A2P2J4H6_RHIMU
MQSPILRSANNGRLQLNHTWSQYSLSNLALGYPFENC